MNTKFEPEAILTLKSPEEWLKINHPNQKIRDPIGWCGSSGKLFTDAITEKEFEFRFSLSTTFFYRGPLRNV